MRMGMVVIVAAMAVVMIVIMVFGLFGSAGYDQKASDCEKEWETNHA
jgi:uncharacterized membrane protein